MTPIDRYQSPSDYAPQLVIFSLYKPRARKTPAQFPSKKWTIHGQPPGVCPGAHPRRPFVITESLTPWAHSPRTKQCPYHARIVSWRELTVLVTDHCFRFAALTYWPWEKEAAMKNHDSFIHTLDFVFIPEVLRRVLKTTTRPMVVDAKI